MAPLELPGSGILARPFSLRSADPRFTALFLRATLRPSGHARITTVRSVSLGRGSSETTAGLTRYSPPRGPADPVPRQTLSFYSRLIDGLSDPAATAVIAHELAHAWLNEHSRPEASDARELEADALARRWGFGPELDALDEEADTVGP